jgi:FkbM family methyltransferase
MKTIDFPYIGGTIIPISDTAVHVNTGWTHPRNDVRFNQPFVYELNVIEFFYSQIKDNDVILDIGAHSGLFSMLAKYNKTTKWHLFEPDPFNSSNLKDNIEVNKIKNAIVYEEALSDYVGECTLNICTNHRGLNTIGKNPVRLHTNDGKYDHIPSEINLEKNLVETLLVKVNTIDNLFLDTKVDLIKIDTEGSEYDIISGGIEVIKKYRPKILLEYNVGNMNQCGNTPEKLNSLIEQIGYIPFWSDNGENLFIQYNTNS